MNAMLIFLSMVLLGFMFKYKNVLNILLSLEMISVCIYFLLSISLVMMGLEMFYLLYFLVMIVCEGVLGLSILIAMSYSFGVDDFKSFNVLLC